METETDTEPEEVAAEVATALIDEGVEPAVAVVVAEEVAEAVEAAEVRETVADVVEAVTGDEDIARSAGWTAEMAAAEAAEPVVVETDAIVAEPVADVAPIAAVVEPDTAPQRTHPYWRKLGRRRD